LPERYFGTPEVLRARLLGDASTSWISSACRVGLRAPPPRELAADAGDLALEAADAALLGVVVDDRERMAPSLIEGTLADAALALLGDQVLLGDVELLELGVARQLDDLQAVLERQRDLVPVVGGRDEHHLERS
jgi:hypothetical protein